MERVLDWVIPIVYFSVFITIFMQILPGEKYKKYVRFFAGLLVIVLVMNPILNLLHQGDVSEKILDVSLFQEQSDRISFEIDDIEKNVNAYYKRMLEESMTQEMVE